MGFDNLVGVRHLFLPPLTTIQLPHDIIGREAALHIIEGREGKSDADPLPAVDPLFHLILC